MRFCRGILHCGANRRTEIEGKRGDQWLIYGDWVKTGPKDQARGKVKAESAGPSQKLEEASLCGVPSKKLMRKKKGARLSKEERL